jgi:hypothetical protein
MTRPGQLHYGGGKKRSMELALFTVLLTEMGHAKCVYVVTAHENADNLTRGE